VLDYHWLFSRFWQFSLTDRSRELGPRCIAD
jgi:hypothetical protein